MAPPPPAKKTSTARTALLVIVGLFVVACPVMGGIAIPAFVKYLRRAKTVEAVSSLGMICRGVDSYVAQTGQLPPPAPLTPPTVARGVRVSDPPDVWQQAGWHELNFAAPALHFYSYQFETDGTTFTARAVGDLDGDGTLSTFERTGTLQSGPGQPHCTPGVYENQELE